MQKGIIKNSQSATVKLLQTVGNVQLNTPGILKKHHDEMLFYIAFPLNKTILSTVKKELALIVSVTKKIRQQGSSLKQQSLMASGIANTELFCSYSSTIAGWLVQKFPNSVELGGSDASAATVRNILQAIMPVVEFEKSTQGELSLAARIKSITALNQSGEQLKWLLQMFEDSHLPELVKSEMYNQLKVFVRWNLDDVLFNRTFLQLPIKTPFYQTDFIKQVDCNKIIKQKLPVAVKLGSSAKTNLLDTMKASLAFLYRETDPVSYADSNELELFDMGRGLQIAIVGMKMERRLALESYVGYMAFKNGVPVSYGGGWMWGNRCKIGVNVFPAFRKGESAWLFCQVMRLYYQHYNMRFFSVKPYQFGKGNPEGIKSGAFWFYYKLGFRSADTTIQNAAALEWTKITADKKYRTPPTLLKKFANANLELKLSNRIFPSSDAGMVSALISKYINQNFKGNRKTASISCFHLFENKFPVNTLKFQSSYQLKVIENWSLLFALISDTSHWKLKEKKAIIDLMRLKQTGSERAYILKLQHHDSFWSCLHQIGT